MSTNEQQVEVLTAKLNALENESRRILSALNWASKVRLILFFGLLLFVLISAFLFYRLYTDIRENRIAEVQRMISDQPEEFTEPLTKQIMMLAEEQGPYIAEVFRKQAEEDSEQYLAAFDKERDQMIANLQKNLEAKLTNSYAGMLDEQEAMLKKEFPVLEDPEKMQNVRENMDKVFKKLGQRYYVDFLKEEMTEIADKLDRFPSTEPRHDNIPLGEQIATEFLELVRMMLVSSEDYVIPDKQTALKQRARVKLKQPASAAADDDNSNDEGAKDKEDAEDDKGAKDKKGTKDEESAKDNDSEDDDPNKDDSDDSDDDDGDE